MNRSQRRALAKSKDSQNLAHVADLHQSSGRIDKAEETYRLAIARDPRCWQAHNNLGNLLVAVGRITEASGHFALARSINPNNATVVLNLAIGLSAQKRFMKAVPICREAIALDPSSAEAHALLAQALTQIAEHDEAERRYLDALKLDPLHFEARINLGLALVDQGRMVEALEHAQILSRSETATGFPHKAFGVLLARANCPDGARLCFEKHLARQPAERDEIAMLFASVGGTLPSRATDGQIARIYAARAGGWDDGAMGPTGYQGHRLVVAALTLLNAHRSETVLDAGCGTGLVGELLHRYGGRLIGVDMSEAMLVQARAKDVYHELQCVELVEYMNRHPSSADVIVSAATLIHFGDLNDVFAAAARCLRADGLFVFTLFPNDDDPTSVAVGTLDGLAQGGCFRHGADYVAGTAARHGLKVELLRREVHEYACQAPIFGLVVALRLDGQGAP